MGNDANARFSIAFGNGSPLKMDFNCDANSGVAAYRRSEMGDNEAIRACALAADCVEAVESAELEYEADVGVNKRSLLRVGVDVRCETHSGHGRQVWSEIPDSALQKVAKGVNAYRFL